MKVGVDCIGVSVGAVIVNDKGEVLLLKRSQLAKNERGKWEAPGGVVEFGETREKAIKREMKEEIGVDIEILETLQVVDDFYPKEKQHFVGTSYLAKIKGKKEPKIMEPHKHTAIGWFPVNKLPKPMAAVSVSDINCYKNLRG